jgi:hypothetical protein
MGVSNGDEDSGGVDADGSGGNSPSRQGAGTETLVPQNWSSMAAALWNFSWIDADSLRVFVLEAIYRQKGDVSGHLRGPHHTMGRPEGWCTTLWYGCLGALLRLPFGLCVRDRKIGTLGFVSSNSKNISFGKNLK